MPSVPNTPGIMAAIQAKCQALQVGGGPFFAASSVIVVTFPDITNQVPCCEVTQFDDDSVRYALGSGAVAGGKIDDSQLFIIELTLDMTNKQAVEQQLAQIRDALTHDFHASAQLATPGVQYSGLEGKGKRGYVWRNGQEWRFYRQVLKVRYEYSVTIVP
jgi:hypothetical protein